MGEAIPRQHPAVVLRSHFNQLRALLAVALIAVAGLTVAVVILATDDDAGSGSPTVSAPAQSGTTRYDGGPEEGTRGALPSRLPNGDARAGVRYDGGPEEGSAAVTQAQPKVTQQQAFPGLANGAEDYAHGPLASDPPAKDYSMNGATGDFSAQPQAQTGSRADGASDKVLQNQARSGD